MRSRPPPRSKSFLAHPGTHGTPSEHADGETLDASQRPVPARAEHDTLYTGCTPGCRPCESHALSCLGLKAIDTNDTRPHVLHTRAATMQHIAMWATAQTCIVTPASSSALKKARIFLPILSGAGTRELACSSPSASNTNTQRSSESQNLLSAVVASLFWDSLVSFSGFIILPHLPIQPAVRKARQGGSPEADAAWGTASATPTRVGDNRVGGELTMHRRAR